MFKMCKVLCSLFVILLSFNNVLTWDIAVTFEDQIEFYSNGVKTNSVGMGFEELTAMAYDAVNNMLYFVNQQTDSATIFSYNFATKKFDEIVKGNSIQGIAFDPVKRLLFWTDTEEKSISWASLEIEANKTRHKNVLFTMAEDMPKGIAVDSCREYIYWTNINVFKPTIERARFNGTEREVIIETDIFMPVSIAIDQKTKTLYWADDKEGIHFDIQSSDLEGKNRNKIYKGIHHQPHSLTLSKDSIYWIDLSFKSVWQIRKGLHEEPRNIVDFAEKPFSVVANYSMEEQIKDIPECGKLANLSYDTSAFSESYETPVNYDLYCLNGDKESSPTSCKCWPGYTGKRCEVFLCQNHCLHGDCTLTTGQPQCRCKEGFTGVRCEVELCNNYCLNEGVCAIAGKKPVCTCSEKFEGGRCEIMRIVTTTTLAPPTTLEELKSLNTQKVTPRPEVSQTESTTDLPNEQNTNPPEIVPTETTTDSNKKQNDTISSKVLQSDMFDGKLIETICSNDWDPLRDSIIMALALLCVIMCGTSTLLFKKILHLKRRPRIKKRIIVNKNVTPLTARPDQCEITIEDCCNMNICETPCFEPRAAMKSKAGKESRLNLIAHMEHPDDLM